MNNTSPELSEKMKNAILTKALRGILRLNHPGIKFNEPDNFLNEDVENLLDEIPKVERRGARRQFTAMCKSTEKLFMELEKYP